MQKIEQRFLDKIEKSGTCWLWTANKNERGYGYFYVDGRMVRAHRWAYEHFVGPIPAGLVIDHLCGTRLCVNPEHLEAVTSRTNTLRGNGLAAVNARVTHCPKGHPYEGDNLYVYRNKRFCRTCVGGRQRAKVR